MPSTPLTPYSLNKYEPSNLYASKIYSEHPIVMWSLDDSLDYIDLLGETRRNMDYLGPANPEYDWTFTNIQRDGMYTQADLDAVPLRNIPFPNSLVNRLTGDTNGLEGICEGPYSVTIDYLDEGRGTFTIGIYYYSTSVYLNNIKLGYAYIDQNTLTQVEVLETFESGPINSWIFISKTFDKPSLTGLPLLKPMIKLSFDDADDDPELYRVYINGLTLGQWAEDTNTKSFGVRPLSDIVNTNEACNAAVNLGDIVECKPYGILQPTGYGTSTRYAKSGFYVLSSEKTTSYARNTSIPMVFGSNNVTQLFETISEGAALRPSILFPGQGFLNQKGQYNSYCVEFWMRVQPSNTIPLRIFGPIASEDGIYIDSNFITLSVGGIQGSHFISEWYRPMLIHFNIIKNGASLLINGEEVINISFNTSELTLPKEFVGPEILEWEGKSYDWIGFYAGGETVPFEIDCVAIYSYPVSIPVAKRRMVYGQGVNSPEFINSSYNGITSYIDYSFADYTANYNYPDFAKWSQSNFNNLIATSKSLSTPTYSLPEIFINSTEKTLEDMYESNKQNIGGPGVDIYFSLRPTSILMPDPSWDNVDSYIYFSNTREIPGNISGIYGVFETIDLDPADEQILFYIENPATLDFIKVVVLNGNIQYFFNNEILQEELIQSHGLSKFVAGIDFDKMSNAYDVRVSRFFNNRKNLRVYAGGNTDLDKTFTGKIFKIGICNLQNLPVFNTGFRSDGSALATETELFEINLSTYTLNPIYETNNYYLDVGITGYWEDYVPLSYFGQLAYDSIGNETYRLDFLQINVGYPKTIDVSGTTYATSYNQVRAYVTFQNSSDGSNALQDTFIYYQGAPVSGVIDLDDYPNWRKTKFEIVDGTIIYPRTDVDFNDISIVYRLEFNTKNSISKPISIKRFEIASQAFNINTFNGIGTRFGIDMFPYTRSGVYYDYTAKNPYRIYKGNTPYLYLTRDSGIELCGSLGSSVERGLSMPINQSESDDYEVSAVQFFVRNDKESFSEEDVKLFEIVYEGDIVDFYCSRANVAGTRAKVYSSQRSTGMPLNGLAYYLNGSLVNELVLTSREWAAIGIAFNPPLPFNFTLGELNITSPFLFNNISYYQATDLEKKQSLIARRWIDVLVEGSETLDWQYWFNDFTWEGMLIAGTSRLYGVDPVSIYNTYIGTNRIIIDDEEGMSLDDDTIRVYQDTSWSISVGTPV